MKVIYVDVVNGVFNGKDWKKINLNLVANADVSEYDDKHGNHHNSKGSRTEFVSIPSNLVKCDPFSLLGKEVNVTYNKQGWVIGFEYE